jgi:hypothetical protein
VSPVVIGIDADEAEYFDRDECAQGLQIPHQQARRADSPDDVTGEHARSALLGAPVSFGVGRHAPDQLRDLATDMAGWGTGELPGQVTGQLATWPPVPQADQPPASA